MEELQDLYLDKGVIKNTEAPGPILGSGPEQGPRCQERNGAGERQDDSVVDSKDHL